ERHVAERDPEPRVLVVHQQGSRVRADAEECAVPDRYLSVVAGEDVEPHRREPDVEGLSDKPCVGRAVARREDPAEEHHEERDDRDRGQQHERALLRPQHHTRSTWVVPKRPAGRNISTSRMRPNGTIRVMPRSAWTYCVVSASVTPTIIPPTTAPNTLSKPP